MSDYQLYIGNKNYSTWSMRPWLVMKHFDLVFTEKKVRFDSFAADSVFKQTVIPLNPFGTVPILVDGEIKVTDSLMICEYLADKHPDVEMWPKEEKARVNAKNLVAKMHNGFPFVRQYLPMNIEAFMPEVGQIIMRDQPQVRHEVEFLDQILCGFLKQSIAYLFGQFTIADAFYAPLCMRLKNYAIPISARLSQYIDQLLQNSAVAEWVADALEEKDFVEMDEPYRIKA